MKHDIFKLDKEQVEACFAATDQADALIGLYKLVFPRWDDIAQIDRWPTCNAFTWKAICNLAMALDTKYHPSVMAGGLWLNNGFSSSDGEHLANWQVDISSCHVAYKEAQPA